MKSFYCHVKSQKMKYLLEISYTPHVKKLLYTCNREKLFMIGDGLKFD